MPRLTHIRLLNGLAILLCLIALPAFGQEPADLLSKLSPAQVEQFRQLSPEQQRTLMQQLGIQSGQAQDQPLETPETVMPPSPATVEPPLDEESGLPLFGYDLFAGVPTTFAPVTDIPIPVDYIVGPGDMVNVQLFGKQTGSYVLVVNRDGSINFPELGPISVAGLTFDQMRQVISQQVTEQMIGVSTSVTMGELRSIRIFVLGDAERPGSYTVSSLSTITNALFSSGGVKPIGSLRSIQLKRQGRIVSTLDLYDLLLRGDTSDDVRLMPGDVIFIPPVGTTVGIDGEVRRPAVYEVSNETSASQMLYLAGGLTPTAYPQGARLSRINERQERTVEDVNLSTPQGRLFKLRAGDILTVPSVLDRMDDVVVLSGNVYRPGTYQYRPGMRLTDLIPSLQELKPLSDLHYVLVRRELQPGRKIVALSADLAAAVGARGTAEDVELAPRDQVTVFSMSPLPEKGETPQREALESSSAGGIVGPPRTPVATQDLAGLEGANREAVIEPLLDELRLQATRDELTPIVRVSGRVRAPGLYPLEPDMRVSDLLRAGGSLAENAYATEAEVTRYEIVNGEYRQAEVMDVDLAAVRAGDPDADLRLQPYDFLNVKEITHWSEQQSVTLTGEIRFPGTYPIRKGETLVSVLNRAGGLTDQAYAEGAVFTRVDLRERERQQLERLSRSLQADLATLALQNAQVPDGGSSGQAVVVGQTLLSELRTATPVGRLAMDLPRIIRSGMGSESDIALEDGDALYVPGPMESVTVIGEVHSATSHVYDPSLSRDDYIALSGGARQRADKKGIYVIRANGQVASGAGSSRWFRADSTEIRPGDTIVVPLDAERMRPIPLWTAVTTILYNIAVAVAAVNSF